jgi:CheY-like chemotaxis protein
MGATQTDTLTVLYVDPDAEHRQKVATEVNAAGIRLRFVTDLANLIRALRLLQPQLVLLHAEVRSPLTVRVLELLASDSGFGQVPVVCLCQDVSDRPFLPQMRTGIVSLLEKPFDPVRHLAALRTLHKNLTVRSGNASGHAESRDLTALVEHLRRALRTGTLTIGEGEAVFERGLLKSARSGDLRGVEALLAMAATAQSAWTFSEGQVPAAPPEELPPAKAERVEELPVLLVDDDQSLCRMFAALLGRHGLEVQTAADGFAGFEAVVQNRFELVIADLDMPRMDGWGMLRKLHADFRTRELPVVFLSCHDDYRDTLRALDAGAQGYLSKSTRPEILAQQLREALKDRIELRQSLQSGHTVDLQIGKLGPQWILREIARRGLSGRIEAHDAWALYRITFWSGRPVHAFAQAGRHEAEGARAFNAFIASNGASGTFERGEFPAKETLGEDLEALIARACTVLNENEARVREGLLIKANGVEVNPELYTLYCRVGPRQWLETARLICEEKLPPREIISRVDASPIEVEETLKDLVRRGVVSLRS